MVLLSKWGWRIFKGPNSIWGGLLRFIHGDIKRKIITQSCPPIVKKDSTWLKDLISVCSNPKHEGKWFSNSIRFKPGNDK